VGQEKPNGPKKILRAQGPKKVKKKTFLSIKSKLISFSSGQGDSNAEGRIGKKAKGFAENRAQIQAKKLVFLNGLKLKIVTPCTKGTLIYK
jgi:hypothetical protein